jgi:hypothetical protein
VGQRGVAFKRAVVASTRYADGDSPVIVSHPEHTKTAVAIAVTFEDGTHYIHPSQMVAFFRGVGR